MILEAAGICKSYGRRRILENLNLKAEPGECIGVVGGNGCGKTTLLSILAGAQKPDSGRIILGGRDTAGQPGRFCSGSRLRSPGKSADGGALCAG